MSLFNDPIAVWAAVLIIVLPILIVAAGEVQERLRQRGSPLERPVGTLKNWVLPLVVVWVLVVSVFQVSPSNFFVRVLATAVVLTLVASALQLINLLTAAVTQRSLLPGGRGVPQLLLLLPRLVVFLVAGWIIVSSIWAFDLTGLFAALGVTSLVISLALQPTLSSLASGLLLLGDRPFKPGDWIKTADVEGQVVDLSWRTSRIRDRNGDTVIIPNSTLSNSTLVNYAEPNNLHRVVVPVQVAFSNPPTSAKEMLLAAARATEGVLEDPPPTIRVKQIDDPLMGYEAHLWIDDFSIAPRVFSDFGSLVWYQSHRMGVPLPSPAFDLYHHDPIQEAADAMVDREELARRIRMTPLLADLADTDVADLSSGATAVRFAKGETIVGPGSESSDTFILWQGRARILDRSAPDTFVDIGTGELFGFLSREGQEHEPFSVVADTDCDVVIIDGAMASIVASRNPMIVQSIGRLASTRLRRLTLNDDDAPKFRVTAPMADVGDRPTAHEGDDAS
jgi:small-conductance mechanosensitive channel